MSSTVSAPGPKQPAAGASWYCLLAGCEIDLPTGRPAGNRSECKIRVPIIDGKSHLSLMKYLRKGDGSQLTREATVTGRSAERDDFCGAGGLNARSGVSDGYRSSMAALSDSDREASFT